MADKEKKYSDIDLSVYDSGFQGSADLTKAGVKKQTAEKVYAAAVANGFQGSNALTQAGVNKQNAANAYANYLNKGFSSQYQGMADDYLNQYLNRDPFSYDFNADALYQQYKDKYIQQGKMAMQDTIGQAAAMTGGYGNSYAASVGNQAYQAQLQNLNDVIPELYQLAYDKYNQDGQNMLNKYSLLGDAIDREYGMWGDKLNLLAADRDYYGQEESNLYNREYGAWGDKMNLLAADRDYYGQEESNLYNREYGAWNDNRNYDTTQYWNETNFGYGKEQDALENARREAEAKIKQEAWELEKADLYGSGGGNGGGNGGNGGGNDNYPPKEPVATGFAGQTYDDAYDYAVKNGVPKSHASGIMTQSEWNRRKSSYQLYGTGGTEVKNYNSYKEYLADITAYLVEQYS